MKEGLRLVRIDKKERRQVDLAFATRGAITGMSRRARPFQTSCRHSPPSSPPCCKFCRWVSFPYDKSSLPRRLELSAGIAASHGTIPSKVRPFRSSKLLVPMMHANVMNRYKSLIVFPLQHRREWPARFCRRWLGQDQNRRSASPRCEALLALQGPQHRHRDCRGGG